MLTGHIALSHTMASSGYVLHWPLVWPLYLTVIQAAIGWTTTHRWAGNPRDKPTHRESREMNAKLESVFAYLAAQYNRSLDNYELKAWYFNGERALYLATHFGD
jgi:hypothetical protein